MVCRMGEPRKRSTKGISRGGFFRPARRPKPGRRPALGLTVTVFVLCALAYIYFFGDNGYIREREVRKEIQYLEEEIALLKLESDELRKEIDELEEGGIELERIGREQLGMIKEGEISYRLVPMRSEDWVLDN